MTSSSSLTKTWEQVELGDLVQQMIGGGTPTTANASYWEGNIPWITSKWLGKKMNLVSGEKMISESAVNNSATHVVPAGSIIFATRVGVGKVGINDIPLAINQDLAGIVTTKDAEPLFLAYQLQRDSIQKHIHSLKRGATIQGITREDLKKVLVSKPPLSEQKAIARVLTTVQNAIAEQERLIAKLKELKRGMMGHLFTHGTKGEKTKMTGIGEIPESWEVVRLGDVCDVKGGKRLPKGERLTKEDTGLPYIRVTDFTENSVDTSDIHFLTPEVQKKIARYTISVKDIYISIAGSIGIVGIIPHELDGSNLTENAAKLCIKSKVIEQRFLMYWLAAETVQRDIKSQTVKNAQPKLALARIQQLPCVVPSTEEQIRISTAIDTVVDATQNAEVKHRVYRKLFKTLLHELMSGERRLMA